MTVRIGPAVSSGLCSASIFRAIVVGVACLVGFLIGIPILTNGGYHVFRFFDDYVALYGLLLLALTFIIAINYIYQARVTL